MQGSQVGGRHLKHPTASQGLPWQAGSVWRWNLMGDPGTVAYVLHHQAKCLPLSLPILTTILIFLFLLHLLGHDATKCILDWNPHFEVRFFFNW